jgi:hypothetical protein
MTRKENTVSARTLRRVEQRFNEQLRALFNAIVGLQTPAFEVQATARVLDKQLRGFRSEVGERLRVIEGDVAKMQGYVGVLARRKAEPPMIGRPGEAVFSTREKRT